MLDAVFPVHGFEIDVFISTLHVSEAARRRPFSIYQIYMIESHYSKDFNCHYTTSLPPVLEYIGGNRGLGERQLMASSQHSGCRPPPHIRLPEDRDQFTFGVD